MSCRACGPGASALTFAPEAIDYPPAQVRELDPSQVPDASSGGRLVSVPQGWPVLVAGNFPGLKWSPDGRDYFPVGAGEVIPPTPTGRFWLCATNTLWFGFDRADHNIRARLEAWHPAAMPFRVLSSASLIEASKKGQATTYDNLATGAGATRGIAFIGDHSGTVVLMATVDAACTVTLLYSTDGNTFHDGPQLAAAGTVVIDALTAAPYVAFKTDVSVTATVRLAWR